MNVYPTINKQLESIKPKKPFPFEKLPIPLFSMLFEFIEADSITHLQRGSNRAIFALCGQTLKYNLGKVKVCTLDTLKFTRPLRPHLGTRCCTFNQLFACSPNLTHVNLFDITYFEKRCEPVIFEPESPLPENRLQSLFSALQEKCPKIISVTLKNGSFSYKAMLYEVFPYLPSNITSLDIEGVTGDKEGIAHEIGKRFTRLVHLNLNKCCWYPDQLIGNPSAKALLQNCNSSLKTLHIKQLAGITDEVANYISDCRELTDLNLENSSMLSSGVKKIVESCKNLTRLNVRRISIDDDTMGAIARCNQLTEIILEKSFPTHFEILANSQQLKIVDIYKCDNISDCTLLSKCNTLERLTILNIKISEEELAELSKALPNVTLDFNNDLTYINRTRIRRLQNSNAHYY